jgi:hypothetical protein
LGLAYGHVIPDNEEPDLVCLGRVLCSKLLLGEAKVEHISGIISSKWSV